MGNSTTSHLQAYTCLDPNLSRDSVTFEFWDSSNVNGDIKKGVLAIAVIVLVFSLIGLPGNAIIILSIIHKKLYKETTHILLLNLAISDFLLCLLVMPFIIVTGFAGGYIFGDSDYTRCQVCQSGLIVTALTIVSVYILGLLSVDRFIFIKFPLRYGRYVTVPRVIVSVLIMWVIAISVAVLPYSTLGEVGYSRVAATCAVIFVRRSLNTYYALLLVAVNIIPVVVTIVANIWIACIVRKQIRKLFKLDKSLSGEQKAHNAMQEQLRKRKNKRQLTLIRVFGAILIANLVVWLPLVICTLLLQGIDYNSIPLTMYIFVYLCLLIHPVIHPLIEGSLIPEIKSVFKTLLGVSLCQKLCKRKRGAVSTGASTDDEGSDSFGGGCIDLCSVAVLSGSQEEYTHDGSTS